MTAAPLLGYWLAAAPRPGRGWLADVAALGGHVAAAEHVLPGLTETQAALVHEECRAARLAFVEAHAERLHAALGPGRIEHLVDGAAAAVPHLIGSVSPAHDRAVVAEGFLRVPAVARSVAAETLHPTARARALAGGLATGPVRVGAMTVELDGGTAHLRGPWLVEDLETAVDLVLLHPDARVGVLHLGGAPPALPEPPAEMRLRRELGCVNKLTTGRKPWIAAVEGDLAGFAVYLLGAFDRVVAAAGACLHVPAPVHPGPRLARRLGGDLLRELAARREPVSVHAPTGRRLCHAVADRAGLAGTVAAHAAGLAGRAPLRPADAFDDDYCRRLAGLAAADPDA
jgi:(3,5-dihydroxyphenyl)acetyl-CoA 1,2-dioxygenase